MKRYITLFTFLLAVFCSAHADEIPYNLLSERIVAKLQKFAQKSINYYSFELYGSDDKESLIKTRKIIDSFVNDKKACGDFVYYWWYMWAPMSERGFVENAYMTKAEAYNCCEIGESLHETKKEEQKKLLQKKYELWSNEGVPESEEPTQGAVISIKPKKGLCEYIDAHYPNEFMKEIKIKISKDGDIYLTNNSDEDKLFMDMLIIDVKQPACYIFKEINQYILMDSYRTVKFEKIYKKLPTKLYREQYEASVKFNKKTSKWEVKITSDFKDDFYEDTGERSQEYLDAISKAIEQSPVKPKKYVTFKLQQGLLWFEGDFYQMKPKAIILDSKSLYDKMTNQ